MSDILTVLRDTETNYNYLSMCNRCDCDQFGCRKTFYNVSPKFSLSSTSHEICENVKLHFDQYLRFLQIWKNCQKCWIPRTLIPYPFRLNLSIFWVKKWFVAKTIRSLMVSQSKKGWAPLFHSLHQCLVSELPKNWEFKGVACFMKG